MLLLTPREERESAAGPSGFPLTSVKFRLFRALFRPRGSSPPGPACQCQAPTREPPDARDHLPPFMCTGAAPAQYPPCPSLGHDPSWVSGEAVLTIEIPRRHAGPPSSNRPSGVSAGCGRRRLGAYWQWPLSEAGGLGPPRSAASAHLAAPPKNTKLGFLKSGPP